VKRGETEPENQSGGGGRNKKQQAISTKKETLRTGMGKKKVTKITRCNTQGRKKGEKKKGKGKKGEKITDSLTIINCQHARKTKPRNGAGQKRNNQDGGEGQRTRRKKKEGAWDKKREKIRRASCVKKSTRGHAKRKSEWGMGSKKRE